MEWGERRNKQVIKLVAGSENPGNLVCGLLQTYGTFMMICAPGGIGVVVRSPTFNTIRIYKGFRASMLLHF